MSRETDELTVETQVVGEQEQAWFGGFLPSRQKVSPELALLNQKLSSGSDEGFCCFFSFRCSSGNGQRSKGSIAGDLKQKQGYW